MTLFLSGLYIYSVRVADMGKNYTDIIRMMKNAQTIDPPEDMAKRILMRLEEKTNAPICENNNDLFYPYREKSDGWTAISDPVTTVAQCSMIYLAVGFFYFVAGCVTILGLSGILSSYDIPVWFKLQPWLALASGIVILISAFLMLRQPGLIRYIQYAMLFHTAFIFVNALFLEWIVSFTGAILYIFILTAAAMMFGLLLLGAVRSVAGHLVVKETRL